MQASFFVFEFCSSCGTMMFILETRRLPMNEFYTEQLIKQKTTSITLIKKMAAVSLSVLMFLVTIKISIAAFPLFLATLALTIFLWRRFNLEFEYLYYNGDLDIDKIMGMQKRKRVFSANVKTIEVLAPSGSFELQQYQNLKRYDCSTNSGNKTYEMVIPHKGQKVRVMFEPNEKILHELRMWEPRKIIL